MSHTSVSCGIVYSMKKDEGSQGVGFQCGDGIKFVFMDESGKKKSDRFFVCGFLELQDVVSFCRSVSRLHNQIKNTSISNMYKRVDILRKRMILINYIN